MKTLTLVFVLQMLCFLTADASIFSEGKKFASNVVNTVSTLPKAVLPDCIFGANTVSFYLFTSNNDTGIPVSLNDTSIPMDPSRKTVFLVHGFTSEANSTGLRAIISNWLNHEKVNIFSLDWTEGACSDSLTFTNLLGYPDAVQNTVDVGNLMARFTMKLYDSGLLAINETRIVGHSLGAHVCGFAGKAIQRLSKYKYRHIVGLDPAGPLFRYNVCEKRLCKTDGEFTQMIHTSATLGIHKDIGMVDFYFNEGIIQPGCILPSCSHTRAVYYFASSLEENCYFVGTPWKHSHFSDGMSPSECNGEICSVAGLMAPEFGGRGTLLVLTNATEPYCRATTLNFRPEDVSTSDSAES